MIESILFKLRDIIQLNIETALSTIDTEKDDGIILESISEDNIFISERTDIQNYPTIILAADNANIKHDYTQKGYTHNILLMCAVVETDETILVQRIYRYLDAMERIIEANHTLGGTVIDVLVMSHEYSVMYTDGSDVMKNFRLQLSIHENNNYNS